MTSHYTWGYVTTLHDFGGVLGRPLDAFNWALAISRSRLLACVWSGPKYHKWWSSSISIYCFVTVRVKTRDVILWPRMWIMEGARYMVVIGIHLPMSMESWPSMGANFLDIRIGSTVLLRTGYVINWLIVDQS